MGITVHLYISYQRENWKKDMKIAIATNSYTVFCCKGEQRTYFPSAIIAEGEYDSTKAFMLIFKAIGITVSLYTDENIQREIN